MKKINPVKSIAELLTERKSNETALNFAFSKVLVSEVCSDVGAFLDSIGRLRYDVSIPKARLRKNGN